MRRRGGAGRIVPPGRASPQGAAEPAAGRVAPPPGPREAAAQLSYYTAGPGGREAESPVPSPAAGGGSPTRVSEPALPQFHCVVVGGGIVGLATAWAVIQRSPGTRLLLLEKEDGCARHQTGRNSGVIHSGIYYRPGSLKARLAREGANRLVAFCAEQGIPYELCGKLIVATTDEELGQLENLHRRGVANGVDVRRLAAQEIQAVEPCARGRAALHVPPAGIVDFRRVAASLAERIAERGGVVRLRARVCAIAERADRVVLETPNATFEGGVLVNCAGLHSDRVARLMGIRSVARIVPFRGEYYTLRPDRRGLVRHLIYPVPNPAFPFLGVHFTRTIDGHVHCGPNAVLAFKREGYSRTAVAPRDLLELLAYAGFWRLARRHWRTAASEYYRSLSMKAFAASLRRLVPAVEPRDLVPAPAGVRAQAVGPDGELVDDFLLTSTARSLHVLNAPSPAATASLALGELVAARVSALAGWAGAG
jgi:L-2-hydroxyglutarate oxidase